MPSIAWLLLIIGPDGPVPAGVIYTAPLCEALAAAITQGSGFAALCARVAMGVPL